MSHKLLVKDQQGEREVLLIDSVAVGRDPRCDISLADPLLSRRHAEFVASGRGVLVRDLNSRNGILVNGRRTQEALLHPGDVVQISKLAVTFLSSMGDATEPSPRAVQPSFDYETVDQPAPVVPPPPGEEKTSLLTPSEIQAVAAASAARGREAGRIPVPGNGAGPKGNGDGGAKPSSGWSVEVVVSEDRTNLVPPPLDTVSAEAVVPDAVVVPAPVPAAEVVVAAAPGAEGARSPGIIPSSTMAITVLSLAASCFVIGVVSTMVWLRPPLSARWLLVEHAPTAVLFSFVVALAAGLTAVVALGSATRRARSGRGTPVA